MTGRSYDEAGVRGQGEALSSVARHLAPTFSYARDAEVLTRFGHYASVIKLTDDLALALCTDGVGSKTVIASALDRYDTIAFDCVAMNVNDLICIGARPIAMVDYLGVHTLDERRTDEILRGLGAAAKEAGISIPGGEMAQLPDVIGSDGRGPGDPTAFDLVGACVGTLHPERMILGRAIEPGDALIGLPSSGIHSNGLSLARKVLLREGGFDLHDEIPKLGCTLGEELLRPTEIYVRAVIDLWDAGIDLRGIAHITGDGLLNLCRLESDVAYEIASPLPTPPIFDLIRETGDVDETEMHRVFNMGIGLVVVVPPGSADDALASLERSGQRAAVIGRTIEGASAVHIPERGLVGRLDGGDGAFYR